MVEQLSEKGLILKKGTIVDSTIIAAPTSTKNKERKREANGFRYIFIDEITLMSDFIEGAALFSDVFATCGMKIVLSGTDSLGFMFTEDE